MFFKKNAKKKYILGASCTLLAVITAGVAVMSTTQTALARATLPGVEKIIQDNSTSNPFVILEIVPEKEDAALGFLVAGEEPVDETAKSIKDMPGAEERSVRFADTTAEDKITSLGVGDAVSFAEYEEADSATGDDLKTVDIRGVFSEAQGGDYTLRDATEQYDTITVVAEDIQNPALNEHKPSELMDMELYRRHMAFRPVSEGTGDVRYAIELTALGDTTDLPVKFVKKEGNTGNAVVGDGSPIIDSYNHQYFVIEEDVEIITGEETDEVDLEAMSKYFGEMIFLKNDDGTLSYMGILTNTQQAMLMFARPPVAEEEEETETVSENEIEETTEETTEEPEETTTPETTTTPEETTTPETTTQETTETPESTTSETTTQETTQTPEIISPEDTIPDELSGEDYPIDDQARNFTTKTMARMSVKLDVIVAGLESGFKYVVVKEADGSDSDADEFYYISSLSDSDHNTVADLAAYESYNHFNVPDTQEGREELVGEIFYVRKDNTLPYEYSVDSDGNGTGDYLFTADYTQEVYDTVSYKGGFTNKEWFKKYVFDLDDAQLEDMCIDVVTVTLEELNENPELLDNADLIYFGDIDGQGFADVEEPTLSIPAGKWFIEYDFDDDNGFGNGSTALIKNGNVQSVAKDGGQALYFDGTDDFLSVNGLLNGVEELTISFVMKTDKTGSANWPYYASLNSGTQSYMNEKYIGFLENSGAFTAERYNSSNLSRPGQATASGDTGVWTHITVVYTASETLIYVDGVFAGIQTSNVRLNELFASGSMFQIGKANWGNGEYFKGWLDDFTIANYAMSEEEVQILSGNASVYSRIMNTVGNNVPIVANRSLYTKDGNSYELKKLAAAIMQSASSGVFGSSGISGKSVSTLSYQDMSASILSANAFVNGNAFVYDDSQKQVVSNDFNAQIYNEAQIAAGFTDVVDEIENENFYLEIAGKEDRITDEITMATAIRHIINHEDKRVVTKTSLRVLDLEPYDFEDYYPESEWAQMSYTDSNRKHKTVFEDIKTADDERKVVSTIETDSICITDGKLDKTKWLIDNVATQFEGNAGAIDVTIMGTKEFIGKIDDLNAEYDLIYIGLDTSIMNTRITQNADGTNNKTANTVYNDSTMNGLVYAHVGDEYPVHSARNAVKGDYRLSGNDITADKLRELREFIEAGYAVIISDGFLTTEGNKLVVNTEKVDVSSNMYTLINDTVLATDNGAYRYFGKNVNTKKNLESSAATVETFSRYMGISKLILKYTDADLPTAYIYHEETQTADYLSPDSDGNYRLYYNVELQNDAAVGLSTTSYDCKLYVDIDADGRYEEEERLTGLSITDSSGHSYQADSSGRFHLKADEKYRIVREIPEGYTGFLAWKLVFEMNDRTYSGTDERAVVRSHIIGYSAVPVTGIKPTINILQITTHPDNAGEVVTTLDLNDAHMHTLYENVQDFDIQVTQIPASQYVSRDETFFMGCDTYEEYIKQFDMLVLGFTDMYKYGNGIGTDKIGNTQGETVTETDVINSMLAIREYALSGRSIMFTHDLNSMQIDPTIFGDWRNWGWYANWILRDIQGMDRFGTLKSSPLKLNDKAVIPDDEKYKYESKYDTAALMGEKTDSAGLSSALVLNWDHKAQVVGHEEATYLPTFDDIKSKYSYGETSRRASWFYRTHLNYQTCWNYNMSDQSHLSYVSQVNSGQITEYPYNIAETFAATHSHPQYLQLNMDTDSRDANNDDDIVVWYALDKIPDWCDSLFAATEMDVRNNFFIYNKGNITYTGSGDSYIGESSEMERKLFVNTLVASYRSGTHAARALFKESEWETSATITSTYLPYDPAMNDGSGGFLDQNLTLNFKTTNMDLRKSDDPIYVKFYVDGTATDHTLAVDGNYYKEITVESIDKLVAQDGSITKVPESTNVISNNSMHQVKIKHEYLGLMEGNAIRAKNSTTVYIRLGYEEMDEGSISLPATESITGLNIVCTQLFELK